MTRSTTDPARGHIWGLSLLALTLALAVSALAACSQEPKLHGWPITPTPAADFALTSHTGQTVRVSDYKGDLVVVTFGYTNCTTACPLIALGMKQAQDKLMPSEASRVHFLVVSVDPERDTTEKAASFIRERPSPQGMLFLTGSRPDLETVWRAYKVETRQVMWTPTPPAPESATPAPMEGMKSSEGGMKMAGGETATPNPHEGHVGYIVEHTVLAYLVDKQGTIRSAHVIDSGFTPDDMVKDMRALLATK